ncbi:unnamed protein product [Diabrotica balteata]|uniref:Uncharacterized protein n=1 Tax=Diabrotica balteata TaxID=107213 RepID=A0A9N9TAT2_DIABA|nr:unnamed protein product [Diabrotica balteata]
MSTTIPEIAVTHDDENDIENDNENNYLNLQEALTDVEDLYEEGDDLFVSKPKQIRKSKLKIKLVQDEALTDLEDFEASDEEDDKSKNLIMHSKPITIEDLDLEGGVFEESYKTHVKTSKGIKKLKTQCSTTQRKMDDTEVEYKIYDNYTDEEIFDTENEVAIDSVPDTSIDLDTYNLENMNVADNTNRNETKLLSVSPNNNPSDTNDSEQSFHSGQFLNPSLITPNLSDLTDIEVLHSDSDDEKSFKKTKPRRRRYKGSRRHSVTDIEDLDVSDTDDRFKNYISHPRRKVKSFKVITKSHSLMYDSDNEDNAHLPFPICKKIAEKKPSILNIPEFDTNFPTDVEDFEDLIDTPATPNFEAHEEAFEKKLEEMAECYSKINESHSALKCKSILRASSLKSNDNDGDNNTDSDVYQSEHGESEKEDNEEKVSYDIRFIGAPATVTKNKKTSLLIPIINEEPLTDCENVNSSDEETSKIIPIALAKELQIHTDEEEFEDDLDELNNIPEIVLPPPIRNLVILKENGTLPTVQILPLVDYTPVQSPQEQSLNGETDEESVSEAEEAMEMPMSLSVSDFTVLDCGVIKETENPQKKKGKKTLNVPSNDDMDELTDTEEIVLNTQKRRRAPKFKHLHERFLAEKNKLSVKTPEPKALTDTEDLFLSDYNSGNFQSLSPLLNLPGAEGLTDIEVLADSSDEEPNFRAMSCTPQQLRELGGEVIMSMEGSGPFSIEDRLQINKPVKVVSHVAMSPVPTDTEDVVTSADEDLLNYSRAETCTPNQIHLDLKQESSTKVLDESKKRMASEGCMYLKGGGYIDLTDSEYMSAEEGYFNDLIRGIKKDSGCISLNLRDGSVAFGHQPGNSFLLTFLRNEPSLSSPINSLSNHLNALCCA